jgi:hypothetical protein
MYRIDHDSRWYASVRLAGALFALALLICPSLAQASGPQIGQVKTVAGDAVVLRDNARVPAKIGDHLFEKDTIQTGDNGAIGITFIDNTTMATGPNSEIALDEYKFDSSNFKGAMLLGMHKGTVSMISGDIARSSPGAMKIATPHATLGVRGTRFVVQVDGNQ